MSTLTQVWQLNGQYFETCNCDFLCPCISSNLAAQPTHGDCTFAMVYHVDQGRYGNTTLDDLSFAIIGSSPGAMVEGNWSVGLVVDERAGPEQQQALAAIASGQAGGPLANLAPLIGEFKGMETAPIRFDQNGMTWSSSIPGILDEAAEGIPGANSAEPIYIDNTLHPANSRLALAKATRSHVHAFGLNWDDDSGRNNGHFAPFAWQGS
jgi:hypothetical protein